MPSQASDQDIDLNDASELEYEMNGEDDEVIPLLYSASFDPSPDLQWHFDRWFDHIYYGLDGSTGEADGSDDDPLNQTPSPVSS